MKFPVVWSIVSLGIGAFWSAPMFHQGVQAALSRWALCSGALIVLGILGQCTGEDVQ